MIGILEITMLVETLGSFLQQFLVKFSTLVVKLLSKVLKKGVFMIMFLIKRKVENGLNYLALTKVSFKKKKFYNYGK